MAGKSPVSRRKRIAYIVGTRPEIIRSAMVISKLSADPEVDFRLVHTGQHYDYLMDTVFFEELAVPAADVNLGIGSASHARQTARILTAAERFFSDFEPDMTGVFGDTNSSLATALAAAKMNLPLAHLEAGCREYEMDVPEEINRRLIDNCSNLLLPVSERNARHLEEEKAPGTVVMAGDPLYDVFRWCTKKRAGARPWESLGFKRRGYAVLTMHRQGNVDDEKRFRDVLGALGSFGERLPIVFPIHPRTAKQLKRLEAPAPRLDNFRIIDPVGYLDILSLVAGARLVITDSGGLQKEAFWSGAPCVTLRDVSGWYELVDLGVNFLVGCDPAKITDTVSGLLDRETEMRQRIAGSPNPFGGRAITARTVRLLKEFAGKKW